MHGGRTDAITSPDRDAASGWDLPRSVPRWIAGPIRRALRLDALLATHAAVGSAVSPLEFAGRVLEALGVQPVVDELSLARIPERGRVVIVANHPFGGLDGLLALALLARRRPDIRVVANAGLAAIPELAPLVFAVDPFAGPDAPKTNAQPLRRALRWLQGDGALLVFPAGEVAHLRLRSLAVVEPAWNPTVARLAMRTDAPVVPMHFAGRNGALFQVAGLLHPRLRTAMLPRELDRARGSRVPVMIGAAIPSSRLQSLGTPEAAAAHLRVTTLLLGGLADANRAAGVATADSRAGAPVVNGASAEALAAEVAALPPTCRLAAHGDLAVYCATAAQIPLALREIGRLREITFRAAGEGTGQSVDLDEFDERYEHLFLWNESAREIVGAYRLGRIDEIRRQRGTRGLYASTLFEFREPFFGLLGPALELGRSFVRAEYQKSFAPLLLLWRGIGEFVGRNPRYARLIGPVSISNDYLPITRQLLVGYLRRRCFDPVLGGLVRARRPFGSMRRSSLSLEVAALDHIDALAAVVEDVERDGKSVPVLVRQYLRLGGRMIGFNVDAAFGDSIDCLVVVDLRRTDRKVLRRYMSAAALAAFDAHRRRRPRAEDLDRSA